MLMRKKGQEKDFSYEFLEAALDPSEEVLIVADSGSFAVEYVSGGGKWVLGLDEENAKDFLSLLEKLGLGETVTARLKKGESGGAGEGQIANLRTKQEIWCKYRWHRENVFLKEDILFFHITDCSREKEQREALELELIEAKRSNNAKSRFISDVSHDIRTPLNAIIGLTELAIEHREDAAKTQEYIHKILQSSNYLLSLLNDVLDMSRIESGRMSLDYESFQMTELLQSVTDIIRPQADDKGQTLRTEWKLTHDSVNGDAVRIKQVLINLLSNAVKYTHEGGDLFFQVTEITKDRQDSSLDVHYRMKVHDNGYGMSEEFLKVIFEPFEKERTGVYGSIDGVGLGMPIAKSLVDLMDGKLSVESRLGEGTVFTVELPLQLQLQETAGLNSLQQEPPEKKEDLLGLRVLLVEDNELTAEVLKDILELTGCRAEWASNGLEAVRIFEKRGCFFDAVLMDVQMPEMDGYEATEKIRKMSEVGARVPIIALTGNAFTDDIAASRKAGMDRHISKPLKRQELTRVLREVCIDRS